MPDEKEPIPKFAARIKAKYPEYKDVDDTLLTQRIVEKYPEYGAMVDMGGVSQPVKKKESTSDGTGGDGLSALALEVSPEQDKQFQETKKRYEGLSGVRVDPNDPVATAKRAILTTVKKPRITSAETRSTTAVKRPMEAALAPIEPEAKGVSYTEASKDLKQVENYYRYNTNRAVSVLSKTTGYNKEQLYSDDFDNDIKQSLQPGNETQRLAYEALQDAKKADRVIRAGGTLDDMAVRLAGLEDKQIAQIDEAPGINSQKFGEATKGRLLSDMFNNPAFQQELNSHPELKAESKQEIANLTKNNPDFGKMHYGQIVSDEMEKMGLNNGILNVVTKDEFDKVVDKLKADGKITLSEENFINENLRSETGLKGLGKQVIGRESISTPGLIENALQGGVTGLESLGKGVAEVTGIYEGVLGGENATAKRDLELASKQVDVTPQGAWHEISKTGGKMLGQSVGIGGGGGLIKTIGLAKNTATALAMSGGIQAYANYAPMARQLFPGETLKQKAFTTGMAGIETVTEGIFRDDKVVRGLMKEFKPLLKNTIEDFTQKKISAAAASEALEAGWRGIVSNAPKIATSFGKAVGENWAEEFSAEALGQVTKGIFQGKPMNEWLDAEALADVSEQAIIGSPFIAGLAARADFMKSRGINSKRIYTMARNPAYWLEQFQETAKLDKDLEAQLPDKIKNLQHATELLAELDTDKNLTEKQKAKYLLTDLDSKIKQENLSQKNDPILRAKENAETVMAIHGNDQIKQDILEGKDDGTYEGDTSDDMSKEEIAAAKILAKANLPGMYDEMAEENPIGVLQEIAQQAQGIDKDGNLLGGGERRQDLIDSGVPEKVIDEAIKLYPKPSTPVETQPEGVAEGVAPSTLEDIYLMSSDELGELQKSTKTEQKQKLIAAVGKDWYDKYSMATNEEKSKMEDSLTDEQKKVFGGVGVSDNQNPEVIKELRQKVAAIESIEGKDALGSRVRQAVTDLANDRNNKESIAILNAAAKRSDELGFSKKEIQDAAIADLRERVGDTDAKSILDTYFTKANEKAETTQVPVTPEATGAATGTTTEIGGNAEGAEPPAEKVVAGEGDDGKKGITHAAVAESRERIGLPEYEGKPIETHETLLAEARNTIAANPNVANEVMQKIDRGDKITNKDNAILAVYKAALDAELEANPTRELYERVSRLAKVLDPSGTEAGKLLESRKLIADGDNLSSFLLEKEAAQGTPLTDTQLKNEAAKYQELKESKEKLEKQLEEEREQHAKDIADLGVNKAKAKARKAAKKSDADYKAERQSEVDAAIEALKKLRSGEQGLQSTIPGLRELQAIAPHVKKVMQSLVNQGADKLDNIIADVHAQFKDVLDGLTTRQVLDIIGGEHDVIKEQTRNEKVNAARLLKREVQLLKELEDARKGKEKAKSETQVVSSNRRIDELKEKIKQVRSLNKNTEAEPVEDLTAGNGELIAKEEKKLQAKIEKLTKDLKEGNYLKEAEKKPILQKSRKAQIMEDRVIDLENKIRHERSKDEYNKRSKWRKGFDYVMQVLGVKRLIQTAVDMSTSFRQGATLISPTKIDVWVKAFQANLQSIFNPKKFERIMYAIRHDEQYHDMVKDGVVFNDLGSADPDLHNEDFRKSFLYNIPIIREPLKASNRSADAFLNVARYEMYKKMRRNLERRGLTRESDPKAFKYAGGWVMNMTGRGNMHSALEKPAMNAVLGNTFYGARLMASRFNLLNPVTYFDPRVPREAKAEAMKDMAGYTVTVMVAGLALAAAGGKISLDPDDPDFLQVRFGDKVYDISGGLATYVRTFLRIVKAGYTKASGNKYEGKKATEKAGMSVLMFFRNKLSPNTAYATDTFFGKAYGQEFDPAEIYHIYPMYADDAIKAFQDEGLMSIPSVLLPNILGIGYGNYGSKGQIDATLEDLLKRNMRTSEMNSEKIRNFKDDGRPITDEEFDEYADKRDAEIEKDINVLYEQGIGGTPYKDLTKEEVIDETTYIKAAATRKVKEELFGQQKKTHDEKRADKKLSKEREKKYKNN